MRSLLGSIFFSKHSTFLRFLLVGVINTAVGLSSVFLFLNLFLWNYWLSTWLGNTIGLAVSYFLNRRFTFGNQDKIRQTLWKFILVFIISYTFSYGIGLYLSTFLMPWIPIIPAHYQRDVAVLMGACLYTVTNYLGHQSFTFKRNRKEPM